MKLDPCNGVQGRGTTVIGLLSAALMLLGMGLMLQRQHEDERVRIQQLALNFDSSMAALKEQQKQQSQQLQRMAEQLGHKQHRREQQHLDAAQASVFKSTAMGHQGVASRVVSFRGANMLMLALKNDEIVGAHILKTGQPWEPELLGTLMDFARPNSTVIDAGANIGVFSLFLAHKVGPRGRVYSFEPQRKVFQVLCSNAVVNGLHNIYAEHNALSYAPGSVSMDAKVQGGGSAGLLLAKAEEDPNQKLNYGGMGLGTGGEPVQARTLDSFNLTNISLLKMDVQGSEPLLVYGARETIKRNMPVIAYEVDDSKQGLDVPSEVANFNIQEFLLGLGYKQMPGAQVPVNTIMLPPGHPLLAQQG